MVHLVLVRHAQSSWNAERRIQGQGGAGLSPIGVEQAERTAAWLAATHPGAVLATSDLQRCRETVAPLAARLRVEVAHDEGLRERDFGEWTGQLVADITTRWPELGERWRAGEDVLAEVGGESTARLTDRVVATYRRLLAPLDHHDTLICVTHGGPIWHGTHALVGLRPPSLGAVANAAVTRIELAGPTAVLETWNEQAHLPAELRTRLRVSRDRVADAPPAGR